MRHLAESSYTMYYIINYPKLPKTGFKEIFSNTLGNRLKTCISSTMPLKCLKNVAIGQSFLNFLVLRKYRAIFHIKVSYSTYITVLKIFLYFKKICMPFHVIKNP